VTTDAPTPRLVFIVGSPRSGTTWLQTLLGAHPSVVTPQETDVFSSLVAPMQTGWDRQRELAVDTGAAERRAKGLPTLLHDEEFHALVESVVARVVAAMAALDPAATVVVEKSPSHSRHTGLIADYLPDATFVHIIRDGRDVAASLRAAANGWGSHWAPTELKRAALLWRETVLGAREAATTGRYVEVRYEDLRAGEPEPLRRAFAACGLTVDDDACRGLLEEYSLARMADGAVASTIALGGAASAGTSELREPSGFYGEGRVGGWTETWTAKDRLLFDAVAGDLLVALGNEPDHEWAGTAFARRRFAWSVRAQRSVALLGRRIGYRSNLMLRRLPGPRLGGPYDPDHDTAGAP
jgi:hypothetical protein